MKIGSLSLIKELNTSIILNTIKDNISISRAEIANVTGLTPATVTNLTAKLLDKKLIKETNLGESSGGRKPVMLEINYDEYNTACVFIGRNSVVVYLFALSGKLLNSVKINPKNKNSDKIIEDICKTLNEIISLSPKRVLGVGVSCEGLIDAEKGICVFSSNMGWENVNLKEKISSAVGIPVFVDNDVRIIALGEKWYGAAKDTEDFILVYTGYGIGTAIMSKGKPYRGIMNYAGELGHITIDPEGPLCSCGNRGCLQAFASGNALIRDLRAAGLFKDEDPEMTEIIDAYADGSETVKNILEKQAYYIGIAVANAINLFNPAEIIFSVYITSLDVKIKDIITDQIYSRCLKASKNSVRIVYSSLNEKAGEKGTAALVVEQLFANPSLFFEGHYE